MSGNECYALEDRTGGKKNGEQEQQECKERGGQMTEERDRGVKHLYASQSVCYSIK